MDTTPEELAKSLQHPLVVIRRHERSVPEDETSYGAPKATYIDGYSAEGDLVTTRGLYERTTRLSRIFQAGTEKWKTMRVKRTLGSQAVTLHHSELRTNGL